MQKERVSDDIYVFTSDLYAQVTAGVILTTQGAVLVDTLVFPEETRLMKRYIEERLGAKVRYVINTHFHADHTTGTCFFPDALVVSHRLCRAMLDTRGRESLEKAKSSSDELRDIDLVLPQIVFEKGEFTLAIGNKTLQLWHTPGHSPDSIVCHVKEDRVLFAADTLMPIPYFADGDCDDFVGSLERLSDGGYEHIVQGHGEVILRGEIEERLQEDIHYLKKLSLLVGQALVADDPARKLAQINIESCGKSRILLNGMAQQLHQQNIIKLANQ